MISYPPNPIYTADTETPEAANSGVASIEKEITAPSLLIFGVSVFLVSVPVFFQAPLVRSLPWLSLVLTAGWTLVSIFLAKKSHTQHWGDLLTGFTWTWLAGSLYWGWLRWEPTLHLPIEAIGLPIALLGLRRNWCRIGNYFYLGSLLGTAITDLYFYLTDLIPHWRRLMQVEPAFVRPIFQQAIAQMNTVWGISWVLVLASSLLMVGILSFRIKSPHWLAFSGAVLSTILVDSLFWVAALLA